MVVDPPDPDIFFNFNADPNPTFNADPDLAPHQSDADLRLSNLLTLQGCILSLQCQRQRPFI
jgi:hypothetical protein